MAQVAKNDYRLIQVLLAPVVSEETTLVAEENEQVVLGMVRDVNKGEVKAAVKLLFKIEVKPAQILDQRDKQRRFGRFMGRRDHMKGAYVSLKPGQEISFGVGAK